MISNKSPEQLDAQLRFIIGCVFAFTVAGMVGLSLFSLIFVSQPMNAIAPADKNFFYLLNDMSKYILGSLATLLAIKGKDVLSSAVSPSPDDKKPEPVAPVVAASAAAVAATAAVAVDEDEPLPRPPLGSQEGGDALK